MAATTSPAMVTPVTTEIPEAHEEAPVVVEEAPVVADSAPVVVDATPAVDTTPTVDDPDRPKRRQKS